MSSNLTYYQLKIDGNKYKFLYVRLMVTTRQKSIGNTQKIKRKISKHTIRENDQTTNEKVVYRVKRSKNISSSITSN